MKRKTKKITVTLSQAILAMTLFFLFPNTAHAVSTGLILGSNMKADSITVNTAYFTMQGYNLDIDGSGGLSIQGTTTVTVWDAVRTTTINIAGGLNLGSSFTFDIGPNVIFDANSGTHNIVSGNHTLPLVTFNAAGAVYNLVTNNLYTNGLTVSGGTLNLNALDLDVNSGNLLINGGTLNASNAAADLSIDGNLTLSSGTLVAPPVTDSGSFIVSGNWEVSGTGTFTHSNGRVAMWGNRGTNITTSSSNADDFYQLSLDGVTTWYLQDDLTVLNSLYLSYNGTTLDTDADGAGAGTTISNLNVGGAFTMVAGSIFNARTSTVTFNGSANQLNVLQSSTFYHVVIDNTGNPGSVIPPSDIDGNLTINDGSLQLANSTINLTGNLTIGVNGSVSITPPTTWTFDGNSAATITDNTAGTDLGAVVLNKTNPSDAAERETYLGSSVKMTSLTIDGTSGTADKLKMGNSGYALTLTGNGTPLTVNGTLDVGTNSKIAYAPAGTTGVNVRAMTYRDVEFNKASNVFTPAGAIDVDGNLIITAGELATGGAQINLAGNWTNSGTFTHGSGTVILDGTSATIAKQTVTGSTTFFNLTKTVTNAHTLEFEDTGAYQVVGLLRLKGASSQLLTVTSDDGSQTADLIVNTGTGTIDLDYLTPVRIDSSTGLLMIATNSTAPSACVNWQGGTAGVNFTWDGSAGTSTWTTATNWDRGMLPATNSNVIIPSASFDPTLGADRTINNVTIQVGGILVLGGSNLTLAGNTFSNNGTLKLQGDEIINFGAGGAAMDVDSGTFEYVGGGDGTYTIPLAQVSSYYDLKINKASEMFLLGAALTVANDLTLTTGILDTDSNGDTAGGTVYSVTVKGNANFSGTFKSRTSTLWLFADGVNEIKTLTTGGNALFNVDINHFALTTDTARISGALNIDGNLTLSDGVLDLDTNNVAVNVAGNVTIVNGASITPDQTGPWTFDGTTQSYTDNNATKQNLGAVVI